MSCINDTMLTFHDQRLCLFDNVDEAICHEFHCLHETCLSDHVSKGEFLCVAKMTIHMGSNTFQCNRCELARHDRSLCPGPLCPYMHLVPHMWGSEAHVCTTKFFPSPFSPIPVPFPSLSSPSRRGSAHHRGLLNSFVHALINHC